MVANSVGFGEKLQNIRSNWKSTKNWLHFCFFQSFHYFIYSLFHFPWSLIRLTGADLSDTLMDRMVKLYNQNSIINLYRNFITIYWKYGWEMFNIKWWVYENRF